MGRKQRRNRLPKEPPKSDGPLTRPAGIWPGDRTRFLPLAGIAVVAVLTLVIYGQTLSVSTIEYEDSFYLVRNPYVNVSNPFSRLVAVWTEPYFANFHPVTTTTWLVDRAFAERVQPFDASLALVYLNFNPPEAERALVYLQRALEISEIQQQGLPDGKQLDISPLQQALGNAYLALGRG